MVGSSSTPQKGGGIYRNLMMPGFTDAGAGTAYVPKAVIPRRTAATTSPESKTPVNSAATTTTTSSNANGGDAPSRAEETFSEACTELHDNRTNKNGNLSVANRDRYYKIKTSVVQDNNKSGRPNNAIPNKNNNTSGDQNTSNDSIEVEATFGFFPSTKPPPSPSPRGNMQGEANDKINKTPKRGTKPPNMPLSPSPRPISPPPVTRKQLAATKQDTDDKRLGVVTRSELSPEKAGSQELKSESEQDKIPVLHGPFAMQRGMKREVSTFSLAPETGAVVEKEENQAKLKQWKEKGAPNQKIDEENIDDTTDDVKDDGETSNGEKNPTRRLDLNALQEIDRMENEKQTGSDELSTSSSIVSSTCSEFGTVIQLGEAAMAARMKEVEEMELAALAEVPSGEEDDTEHRANAPQLSSTSLSQHDNSLNIPVLNPSVEGGKDASIATSHGKDDSKLSDAKTTVASANSTVNPMKRNPTKSEMVSAAFRRIGPLHTLKDTNAARGDRKPRNSLSAPTTPMRLEFSNQSKQPQQNSEDPVSSPSRYETASDVAGDKKTRILSPRFASFLRARGHGDTTSVAKTTTETNKAKIAPPSPRVAITQTFQYAQKYFTNDKPLTEYGTNAFDDDTDLYDIDERRRHFQEDLVIPPLGQRPTTARLAPRVLPLESSSFLRNRRGVGNSNGMIRPSQSLDYSSSRRSPFRELPSSTSQRYPFLHHSFPAPPPSESAKNLSTFANINLRGRIDSDFSPSKVSKKTMALNSTMELRQTHRIEIEREDALDILACLVEQGIADSNTSTEIQNIDPAAANDEGENETEESSIMKTTKEEKTEEGASHIPPATSGKMDTNRVENYEYSDADLKQLIDDFQKWIEDQDEEMNSGCDSEIKKRHQSVHRTKILQELVKSHAYAVDMKRASASASAWLKSIGRGQGLSKHEIFSSGEKLQEQKSSTNSKDETDEEKHEINESHAIDKMDRLTLKATLHSARLELTETKQLNSRLNEELSKCRAEIGRIKSLSRIDHINKSVFDDSSEGSLSEKVSEKLDSNAEGDITALKNALEKANDTIRKLHNDLLEKRGAEDEETEQAPIVDVPRIQVNKTQSRSQSSTPDSTHRTVNVRMLDGENFVTEWDDLRSLPPPPDHGLQSPIVSAVLEQWNPDRSLHESVFSWMEDVMKGDNLDDLPPLVLSSLDHQVRDGFTMHVLPHLLRRADIHVAVKNRTHRKTTYDISVTVSQKKEGMLASSGLSSSTGYFQSPSLLDRRDSMSGDEWANRFEPRISSAESVAHSAVTETITNHLEQPPKTPVQTEYSEFSSQLRSRSGSAGSFDDFSQQHRHQQGEQNQETANGGTIMGALGGALSGLLSRNKYAVSPRRFHASQARLHGSTEDSRNAPNMLQASVRAQMDLTSSPTPGSSVYNRVGHEATLPASIDNQRQHHQEEPYHRVVSAPPGRIGLTFVEFRGHAMVSDVAMDSPLAGWVFPSDILIAVDEIPVSGMRVRDIVTILSDRKNRQRAMRVMSSHDMNEFTMMSQVGGPLNEGNGEDD